MKKITAWLLAAVCLFTVSVGITAESLSFKAVSYQEYLMNHPAPDTDETILIRCAENAAGHGIRVSAGFPDEPSDCLVIDGGGSVSYTVSVSKTALYSLSVRYVMAENGYGPFAFTLLVDGVLPYEEARELVLPRLFRDEGELRIDSRGNDIRQRQVPAALWQTRRVRDSRGYINEPLKIRLTGGEHTITLLSLRDTAVLSTIELTRYDPPPLYREALVSWQAEGLTVADDLLIIEAESTLHKTAATLQAVNDRASPSVSPYRGAKIVMNAIGGGSWKDIGQEITWQFQVEKDGLYAVTLKAKQNISAGQPSHRKLLIDGELPFIESESFSFSYNLSWENHTLSDASGEPYLFKLTQGTHTLTLAVTLGGAADIISELDRSVYALNDVYRKIIMVTGAVPDIYRDYDLHLSMPGIMKTFETESNRLTELSRKLTVMTGLKGEHAAVLERAAEQLVSFLKKPRTIAQRLDMFKSNLTGMASLILALGQQYLTVDLIALGDPQRLAPAEAGFFANAAHTARVFIASFTEDFNTVGDIPEGGDALTLWITTGRDQAEVIRRLIDESFSPDTGVAVNVKLVPSGVLLSAVLANKNPDVVIQLGAADPVNYAMRGALVNLSDFEDYTDVAARFINGAAVPFTYRGGYSPCPKPCPSRSCFTGRISCMSWVWMCP